MEYNLMWFKLKKKLREKNSWGKNELKELMENIEIAEAERKEFE